MIGDYGDGDGDSDSAPHSPHHHDESNEWKEITRLKLEISSLEAQHADVIERLRFVGDSVFFTIIIIIVIVLCHSEQCSRLCTVRRVSTQICSKSRED